MFLAQRPPASPDVIKRLKGAASVRLPDRYYQLLEFSNGGEWPLPKQPYNFVMDSAEEVTCSISDRNLREFFGGFLMIGSNGAGEYIAFDIRGLEPWSVVAVDMTNIDLNESVMVIASTFDTFYQLIGVDHQK